MPLTAPPRFDCRLAHYEPHPGMIRPRHHLCVMVEVANEAQLRELFPDWHVRFELWDGELWLVPSTPSKSEAAIWSAWMTRTLSGWRVIAPMSWDDVQLLPAFAPHPTVASWDGARLVVPLPTTRDIVQPKRLIQVRHPNKNHIVQQRANDDEVAAALGAQVAASRERERADIEDMLAADLSEELPAMTPAEVRDFREGWDRAERFISKDVLLRFITGGDCRETQFTIDKWQQETFPGAVQTAAGQAARMTKEVGELLTVLTHNSPDDEAARRRALEECADVYIFLVGVASKLGGDLHQAVDNKMQINRQRKWQRLDDGSHQHVEGT